MITSKTRKWGGSLGVLIPKNTVKQLRLRENQEVILDIKPKDNPLKELFGSLKTLKFKKSTGEALKELRGKESRYV